LINSNNNVFSYTFYNLDLTEKLAVFVNKNKNFSELININKQRKSIIFSPYESISVSWLGSNSIEGNIYKIHDSSLNYLINDMCVMIIIGFVESEKVMDDCISLVVIIFQS
jgi:hypothetical protein